jgi:hypothetical protein
LRRVVAERGQGRARLPGDAREAGPRPGEKREKGERRLDSCRDAAANGDAGEREKTGGVGDGRKGKADKRDPLVSCPGRKREGRPKRCARLGWAGSRGLIRVRGEKKKGKGGSGLGRAAWAGGPVGVLVISI